MRAGRPRCPSNPMHAMALHHTTTMGVCYAQGGGGCSLLSGVSCVLHLHVCLVISREGEFQYVSLFWLSRSYTLVRSTPSRHSLQLTPWAALVEMTTEVSLENTKWVHMTACFVSACHPKVCSRVLAVLFSRGCKAFQGNAGARRAPPIFGMARFCKKILRSLAGILD